MMSYDGLTLAADPVQGHLGGNIRGGDPFTFAPTVWDYLIGRFAIESVLDLGSGAGNAARFFAARGCRTIAVDGFAENALTAVYPTVVHDLTSGPVVTRVDLVHCQEVVEHIEEQYLGHLLDSLTCGKFLVMTHAVPGQAGYHHVNCQPSTYWIGHLAARGFSWLDEDSRRVREFARIDGAAYLVQNGMVFANSHRI